MQVPVYGLPLYRGTRIWVYPFVALCLYRESHYIESQARGWETAGSYTVCSIYPVHIDLLVNSGLARQNTKTKMEDLLDLCVEFIH